MNDSRGEPATTRSLPELEPWIDERVAGAATELVEFRRHLHAHPEPSGEEIQTTAWLADRLRERGLEPTVCRNDVGLMADLTIGTPAPDAPLVAIRVDIDALRLFDRKDVGYRSQRDGVAHACGHDAHATLALGTAGLLSELARNHSGEPAVPDARIRFIFQPAEETCQGAHWMVQQGAMNGVDTVLGIHVDPERTAGVVGIRYGVLTAHCDEIAIHIEGNGGHAARPHHTSDPIAAAAQLVGSLHQFLHRSVDSRDPFVFTIGQINGGHAPNVIPDEVLLRGSLRTTDVQTRETLRERLGAVCAGVEQSSGNEVSIEFCNPLSAVRNNRHVMSVVEDACCRVVGPANIQRIDKPSMGGEDFSVYLDHAPGAQLRLGCARPGGEWPLLHSPVFDIDESSLAFGVRILARAAIMLAQDPELRERSRE